MRLPQALLPLRENMAAFGLLDGTLYTLSRGLEKLTGGRGKILKFHFVAQPVASNPLGRSGSGSGNIQVSTIPSEHALVKFFPRPANVIARRYSQGDLCFTATRNGEFAGYLWLAFNSYRDDEIRCLYLLEPATRVAWDYDVYVVPSLRLSRAFTRLWQAANGFMAERGIEWTISRISAFNPNSLASHRRLGMHRLLTAVFVCLGPIQLAVLGGWPFVHLSMGESSVPVLRLKAPKLAGHGTT